MDHLTNPESTVAERKPWVTPRVTEGDGIRHDTAYLPGLAGDNYSFYNVTS